MMTIERWTKGYTQSELDAAQQKFQMIFPPDLVALLRDRRPVNGHDWTDEAAIRRVLAWPFEGLLYDVEHNALWWPEWGEKPDNPAARKETLQAIVSGAPKLIPLISHRYLPNEPCEEGNPVFSIYQSDVIYYGKNLMEYFELEFANHEDYRPRLDQFKYIRFWSDLVERG